MNDHANIDRHREKHEQHVEHHRNENSTLALLIPDGREAFRSEHSYILRFRINFDSRLKLADTYNYEELAPASD